MCHSPTTGAEAEGEEEAAIEERVEGPSVQIP